MKEYQILGVKVQTIAEHVAKHTLNDFLNSDSQHQIVTVNPEFVIAAKRDAQFLQIINNASLATIDGTGLIFGLKFLGQTISLDERLTGVRLTEMLLDMANNHNHKIMLCILSHGLTSVQELFMAIKNKYPHLDFQVADENDVLSKAQNFSPDIILVGWGAPRQDLWIAENLDKVPSVKVAIGVGGTFDFISGKIKRAPKALRSFGLEWLWRLLRQPWRLKRINRALIVFPWLVINYRLKKYGKSKD